MSDLSYLSAKASSEEIATRIDREDAAGLLALTTNPLYNTLSYTEKCVKHQ